MPIAPSDIQNVLAKKYTCEQADNYTDMIFSEAQFYDSSERDSFIYNSTGLFMKDVTLVNIVITDFENGQTSMWDSRLFQEQHDAKDLFLSRATYKPQSTKGVYWCPHCKGDEFIIWQQRTRSGDEAMTTYRQCVKCKPQFGRRRE